MMLQSALPDTRASLVPTTASEVLARESQRRAHEHFLRVLRWMGSVLLSKAIALKDATLGQRNHVIGIGRFDSEARTCVLDSFR